MPQKVNIVKSFVTKFNMEELIQIKQISNETIIKCNDSIRRVEIIFSDEHHDVKSVRIERKEN